ncbi:MAG: LytR/AlgR family response regulator transcription factor [Lewinella sp.]|uniref:LytR/AlgR family response regulator transcription factor n=1 Tax=Lewinella sp. TaxID=2004506 RepID=UPI003D6AB17A
MMTNKIILVEDDELFALDVRMMLDGVFNNPDVIHFRTAVEAKQALERQQSQLQLLLIDVVLENDKAGIHLGNFARKINIPVIFMTAYNRDDLFKMALKVQPYSYLQKPFSSTRLKRAIELAMSHTQAKSKQLNTGAILEDFIFLKDRKGVLDKIHLRDIYLLEAFGNYCHFHCENQRYTHRMPLKQFQEYLKSKLFIRIHRNYVINIMHLERIHSIEGFVVVAGQSYPLSDKYKKGLKNLLIKRG